MERSKVLEQRSAVTYPGTVAATVVLTLDKLSSSAPIAMRLLEICSLCSPDALPLNQFLKALPILGDREQDLDTVERLDALGRLRPPEVGEGRALWAGLSLWRVSSEIP